MQLKSGSVNRELSLLKIKIKNQLNQQAEMCKRENTTWIATLVLFFFCFSSHAQWKLHGVPNQVVKSSRIKSNATPMSLPFWDDFSFVNTIADTLWFEKNTVRVMDDMGINLPSLGVAVFDGLNAAGSPYVTDDLISSGFNDLLLSRPVKLNEVPPANRTDKVFLSFAWQWKGKGEGPDPGDYLQIDFKDDNGNWVPVKVINVIGTLNENNFTNELIPIVDTKYFHETFQFRIRNYGRRSGAFDTWLIDYVYLNQFRSATDLSFPDRALASQPGSIFGNYTAVPAPHFKENFIFTAPSISVQSNNAGFTVLEINTDIQTTYYENEIAIDLPSVNLEVNRNIEEFDNFQRKNILLLNLPNETNTAIFPINYDSLKITLSYILGSGDNKIIGSEPFADYDPAIYAPIDFRYNDTTQVIYDVRSYYAYDDDEAEFAVSLDQDNYLGAQKFEMLTIERDTLTAVYIYFPTLAGQLSSLVEISIWADDAGVPSTTPIQTFNVPINRTGLDTYQKIKLGTGVIVDPIFYIGWREPQNGFVAIGLDKSSKAKNILYENTNGTWQAVNGIDGAIMIRPAFEKADIITGTEETDTQVNVFPNPNQTGEIYLPIKAEIISWSNINGSNIAFEVETNTHVKKISMLQKQIGLSIIQFKVGQTTYIKKVITL